MLLGQYKTSGYFREFYTVSQSLDLTLSDLNARVARIKDVVQLIEKPKKFKDTYTGSASAFTLENQIPSDAKFEILSRDLPELEIYF